MSCGLKQAKGLRRKKEYGRFFDRCYEGTGERRLTFVRIIVRHFHGAAQQDIKNNPICAIILFGLYLLNSSRLLALASLLGNGQNFSTAAILYTHGCLAFIAKNTVRAVSILFHNKQGCQI